MPTPDEYAAAVEADLVEHVARLHAPPVGEVHRDDGTVWFTTGLPTVNDNGVLRDALPVDSADASIEGLLQPFLARCLPLMWWRFVGADGRDDTAASALARHGFVLDADRPGMGLDLSRSSPPPPPHGVTIHRVRDETMFHGWADVVGRAFDDPDFVDGNSVAMGLRIGYGDDAPFRHFLCRLEGAWVGASTLSLGAGVAGLANISTVPEHRGRGIGAAAAGAALTDARAIGLRIAALSADGAGVGVYEKLGFTTVSRHLTYVRPADDHAGPTSVA
jgi:ribosomal protein S18 acetylase RimI-like enzyme